MDLHEHYGNLFKRSANEILAGNYLLDDQLDSDADDRRGLTLLFRPDEAVRSNMQDFLTELRANEPAQYYYPDSDMHVTVLSLVSCYSGFGLGQIAVQDYVEIIEECLLEAGGIEMHFRGITASPAAVMVQGFPANGTLHQLRDRLRKSFRDSVLQHSMDSRYTLCTAHATVARFRKPLRQPTEFVDILEKYRQHDFGKCRVGDLELVYNDWYQRANFVQKLHTFRLG
ncbi:mutarotase [Pontibacter sp. JH31]|uniref:Mutarotase n=1 Tax=Pontibacter aquaedesilientis TaxID=2766980 RepID=A0ABR7XDX9_9BACT|nr:mutarotase [Pontibacter aquaedesilientis]MBD1396494.1 mutarotase [Pontibacter aquaedesilientis]